MNINIELLKEAIDHNVKNIIEKMQGELHPTLTKHEAVEHLGVISAIVISLFEKARENEKENYSEDMLREIWDLKKESDNLIEKLIPYLFR